MKLWIRKSLIILVSILTFGAVTPSHALWSENDELPKAQHRGNPPNDSVQKPNIQTQINVAVKSHKEQFIEMMTDEAERQALIKFGPKISDVIIDEFQEIILPHIEAAIEMTAAQFSDEELDNLAITETPGGGVSEKIFNIYNVGTKQDVIRFHVRRDKPPLEGYKFNFHYHTYHDQFQTHYTIGTIDWNKNTPPNWRTV
ncbi:YpjP family protein [Bacillus sp. FJAT-49732]|uniref:YpjP family protein n=1 Tax=Lederbergia citrisecunda TaxID=2833583 RepID=A0A942TP81_9BACI|nr:YpjP family protein [Lederbergia citrisecunda]MBS4199439.1 YpjP family protein [Lederbergia citrisecunda]